MGSFRERVDKGTYDELLLGQGSEDPYTEELRAMDKMEEAWSLQKVLDRKQDWVGALKGSDLFIDYNGMWRWFHHAFHFKGVVRNITRNLVMLTGSPEITFKSEIDKREWKRISRANWNAWPRRRKDIIQNTYLLNDWLTIVYPSTRGDPRIRSVEPWNIQKILRNPKDRDEIQGYVLRGSDEVIPAAQVTHHRVDVVAGEERGVPILAGAMRAIHYLGKWEEDLYYTGHMRARIPVVREVDGSRTQVDAEANRMAYLPGPGRWLVQNKGCDVKYPPVFTGMRDAETGHEVFIKSIAMCANLPFFLVSEDYRNNSLASSLSADSPTTKFIKNNQETYGDDMEDIVNTSLGELRDEVRVKWPPVIERDKEKLSKVYQIGAGLGAVSSRDYVEDVLGKSWDEVQTNLDDDNRRAQEELRNRGKKEPVAVDEE